MHTRLLFKHSTRRWDMAHGSVRMLILIEYIYCADVGWIHIMHVYYETVSRWLWTNSQPYVEFECIYAWCAMYHDTIAIAHLTAIQLQWQWYTALRWCTLACYANTQQRQWHTAHGSALILMLTEYMYCVYIMKRYRVGFGRTGSTSTLVLVHVWI